MGDVKKAAYEELQDRERKKALDGYATATPGQIYEFVQALVIRMHYLQLDESVSRRVGRELDRMDVCIREFISECERTRKQNAG